MDESYWLMMTSRCCWVMLFVINLVGIVFSFPAKGRCPEDGRVEGVSTLGVAVVVTRERGKVIGTVIILGSERIARNDFQSEIMLFGADRIPLHNDVASFFVLAAPFSAESMSPFMNTPQPSDIPFEVSRSESPTEAVVTSPRSFVLIFIFAIVLTRVFDRVLATWLFQLIIPFVYASVPFVRLLLS